MGRLGDRFAALRERGEAALVCFVTAGDPDLESSEALVLSMAESGADVIEIGMPFSDPIAEGPTIQRASERALAGGVNLRAILEMVRGLRSKVEVPLVLMGYANPVHTMGYDAFSKSAAEAGVDGIIIADLPPEEGAPLYDKCNAAGVDCVLLAAPTTTPERMQLLVEKTRGFLYYVSLTGVTGARSELAGGIEDAVRSAQSLARVPVCVGFGIATPEQAREVGRYADGVVVGSAIIDRIEGAANREDAVDAVARFVAELKNALRR
ncbi:MAG: tryptophan synthase subunit alpha [Deltaproteobacteria bacterium]|nr:tryptophan synthase subunit alpha [Deltaproteobacteria bacterium]MBW2418224.1 tryptophan synthase subunit alpha [Deltaproteobacteria bacterium]